MVARLLAQNPYGAWLRKQFDFTHSIFACFDAQNHMFVGDQRRPSPEVHMDGFGVYEHHDVIKAGCP
jgi:hypothetical protein